MPKPRGPISHLPLLFEDDALMVINKPAGLVVNRAETVKELTVQDWVDTKSARRVRRQIPMKDSDFDKRSGVVHRLDKDTSGVLLVAKTPQAFTNLQLQFFQRLVKKKYTALVHGVPPAKDGQIDAPVGRLPWNRERFGVVVSGKEASTYYHLLQTYEEQGTLAKYALLELAPVTGRTHQIRVHLKYLGLPIVTDLFYAGRKQLRHDMTWCPRIFLHAGELSFSHPITGKSIVVSAPLPSDLTGALANLLPKL